MTNRQHSQSVPEPALGCALIKPVDKIWRLVRRDLWPVPTHGGGSHIAEMPHPNWRAVRNRPRWDYSDFLAVMNAEISACFQCVGHE